MTWTDRVKEALQFQLISLRKVTGPANLVLLIATWATLLAGMVEWRGYDPKLVTLVVGLTTGLTVLVVANVWTRWLKLHREEQKTNTRLNPYQVNAFTPFQAATWTHAHLPRMRALRDLCQDQSLDDRAHDLDARISTIERWVEQGYIPSDRFPEGYETYLRDQEDEPL